jgi:monofunctional biosynthetic peptidoglycan transglycosylase
MATSARKRKTSAASESDEATGAAPKKKPAAKKRSTAKKKSAARRKTASTDDAGSAPAKKKAAPKKKAASRKKPAARKKAAATDSPEATPSPKPRRKRKTRGRGLSFSPRVRHWSVRALIVGLVATLCLLAGSTAWVILYRGVDPPGTFLMVQRYYEAPTDARRVSWAWRDLNDISPNLAVAVLAAEDQRFPDHNGFDTIELQNAIDAWQDGERLRGASTISQQTAKNAFLFPTRSFMRKGMELWFTALIEAFWPKRRILEMYLNIAEWGDGIYGAEAAARHYFNKSANALSPDEAARLASILPNPRERSPMRPSPAVARKQVWIRQQVHNLGGPRFLERIGVTQN